MSFQLLKLSKPGLFFVFFITDLFFSSTGNPNTCTGTRINMWLKNYSKLCFFKLKNPAETKYCNIANTGNHNIQENLLTTIHRSLKITIYVSFTSFHLKAFNFKIFYKKIIFCEKKKDLAFPSLPKFTQS